MNVTAGIMPAQFDLTVTPAPLWGTVTPPPSKSQSHRVLIAAALGTEKSRVGNLAARRILTPPGGVCLP